MFSAYAHIVNFLNSLPTEKLHLLMAGTFVLIAAGWRLRPAGLRRSKPQPLVSILSDAILVGSHVDLSRAAVGDRAGVEDCGTRWTEPVLGGLERLDEKDRQWGFSVQEAGKPILTLIYPGEKEAGAAREAMQRAFRDLAFVVQPEKPWDSPPGQMARSRVAAARGMEGTLTAPSP